MPECNHIQPSQKKDFNNYASLHGIFGHISPDPNIPYVKEVSTYALKRTFYIISNQLAL